MTGRVVQAKAYNLTVGVSGDFVSQFLGVGVVHEQVDNDTWFEPNSTSGRANMALAAKFSTQHIGGFGVSFPNWNDTTGAPQAIDLVGNNFDQRVTVVQSQHQYKALTLALCPPQWRETYVAQTDAYSPSEFYVDRVKSTHVSDFASLCGTIISSYPTIDYVNVWNEFKGYYNPATNDWSNDLYVALFNAVYTAVKSARSTVKVGGPYSLMPFYGNPSGASNPSAEFFGPWGAADQRMLDSVKYWLQNKVGADYLVIDGGNTPYDGVMASGQDHFKNCSFYYDFVTWVRSLNNTTYPGSATLPIIWSEWYTSYGVDVNGRPLEDWPRVGAVWAEGMRQVIRSKTTLTACQWQPCQREDDVLLGFPLGFTLDPRTHAGAPTNLHPIAKMFSDYFTVGKGIYVNIATGNANISCIGSTDGKLVLINKANSSQATSGLVGAATQTLTAYEVRLINWTHP